MASPATTSLAPETSEPKVDAFERVSTEEFFALLDGRWEHVQAASSAGRGKLPAGPRDGGAPPATRNDDAVSAPRHDEDEGVRDEDDDEDEKAAAVATRPVTESVRAELAIPTVFAPKTRPHTAGGGASAHHVDESDMPWASLPPPDPSLMAAVEPGDGEILLEQGHYDLAAAAFWRGMADVPGRFRHFEAGYRLALRHLRYVHPLYSRRFETSLVDTRVRTAFPPDTDYWRTECRSTGQLVRPLEQSPKLPPGWVPSSATQEILERPKTKPVYLDGSAERLFDRALGQMSGELGDLLASQAPVVHTREPLLESIRNIFRREQKHLVAAYRYYSALDRSSSAQMRLHSIEKAATMSKSDFTKFCRDALFDGRLATPAASASSPPPSRGGVKSTQATSSAPSKGAAAAASQAASAAWHARGAAATTDGELRLHSFLATLVRLADLTYADEEPTLERRVERAMREHYIFARGDRDDGMREALDSGPMTELYYAYEESLKTIFNHHATTLATSKAMSYGSDDGRAKKREAKRGKTIGFSEFYNFFQNTVHAPAVLPDKAGAAPKVPLPSAAMLQSIYLESQSEELHKIWREGSRDPVDTAMNWKEFVEGVARGASHLTPDALHLLHAANQRALFASSTGALLHGDEGVTAQAAVPGKPFDAYALPGDVAPVDTASLEDRVDVVLQAALRAYADIFSAPETGSQQSRYGAERPVANASLKANAQPLEELAHSRALLRRLNRSPAAPTAAPDASKGSSISPAMRWRASAGVLVAIHRAQQMASMKRRASLRPPPSKGGRPGSARRRSTARLSASSSTGGLDTEGAHRLSTLAEPRTRAARPSVNNGRRGEWTNFTSKLSR